MSTIEKIGLSEDISFLKGIFNSSDSSFSSQISIEYERIISSPSLLWSFALAIIFIGIFSWLMKISSIPSQNKAVEACTEDIDGWWSRLKNGRHSKLILPPNAIRLLEDCNKDQEIRKTASSSPVQQTTRLMKKMYKATLGRQNNNQSLKFTIDISWISEECTPLVCFVNTKSGGQQGHYFNFELKRLLNPAQVFDISKVNPVVVLEAFLKLPRCRVLVAGGDGTIGWILDTIDSVILKFKHFQRPAISILPIGTGNDLANELGWLNCIRNHALNVLLEKVQNSQLVMLDRWNFSDLSKGNKKNSAAAKMNCRFQNYCGIGVDAQIVLQFHLMRKSSPGMFFHRYINKLWYGFMGWQEIWRQTHESFPQEVELYCDGKQVELPSDSQGIVFLNISSYGGGSVLWGNSEILSGSGSGSNEVDTSVSYSDFESYDDYGLAGADSKWKPVNIGDRILEVVSVRSSLELAQIKLGITSCQKIAQGKEFELVLKSKIPIQFDGEPKIQSAGRYFICSGGEQAKMLRPVPDDMDSDLVEVLDWAQRQRIITSIQQDLLMEEYVKRVEKRRLRNLDW